MRRQASTISIASVRPPMPFSLNQRAPETARLVQGGAAKMIAYRRGGGSHARTSAPIQVIPSRVTSPAGWVRSTQKHSKPA